MNFGHGQVNNFLVTFFMEKSILCVDTRHAFMTLYNIVMLNSVVRKTRGTISWMRSQTLHKDTGRNYWKGRQ